MNPEDWTLNPKPQSQEVAGIWKVRLMKPKVALKAIPLVTPASVKQSINSLMIRREEHPGKNPY
jgi:hypothetical protein